MYNQGDFLQSIEKNVTQEQIRQYAEASGDYNPIHIDEQYASTTPFGSTVAHGLLTLAFLAEMMAKNFGKGWVEGGGLNIRFTAPVKPGDTVTCGGFIKGRKQGKGGEKVLCSAWCKTQQEKTVITGDAWAAFK